MAQYLAIAATILAAALASWTVFRARRPRAACLDIVDVRFYLATVTDRTRWSDPRRPQQLVVDFVLRNTGGQVLVIKKVEIAATHAYNFEYFGSLLDVGPQPPRAPLPSTAQYEIALPWPEDSPLAVHKTLAQEIKPGEADRFALALVTADSTPFESYRVYRCSFTLVYNSDERKASDQYIVAVPELPPHEVDYVRFVVEGFVTSVRRRAKERAQYPERYVDPDDALKRLDRYLEAEARQLNALRQVLKAGGVIVTGENTEGRAIRDVLGKVETTVRALPAIGNESRATLQELKL